MDAELPKVAVAEILAEKMTALDAVRLPAAVRSKCEDLLIDVVGLCVTARKEDYVQAARAMGLSHPRIIAKHILPNTMGYVVVATTLRIPGYILGESALSLLGLGIMEPTPSWGNMLQKAMDILELNQHPWVLWPGVFIFLAIMAFNLVGDGLRDAVDPRGLTTR